MESGAERGLVGEDVERENIIHPLEPGEHHVVAKKRHMNVGCHWWLPNWVKEGLETIKGRKVSLVDGWILQKDYRRVGGRFFEQLKQGKKNISAPKAVMLKDGEKCRGRGRPLTLGGGHLLIIHDRDERDESKRQR